MLDPWIIEEIRRREEERRRYQDERPVLEIPMDSPPEPAEPASRGGNRENRDRPERGVVILNYTI